MTQYNPFVWNDGTPSIFAPKPKTTHAEYQRSLYWRNKTPQPKEEQILKKNRESFVGYNRQNAVDKTNAIRNSTP